MMRRSLVPSVLHGVVGGLIAGATVALWFLVVDTLTIEPFWTPAALAGAILHEEVIGPTFRLVAIYTVLHFGVFALLGAATGWVLATLDVAPGLLVGGVFGIGVLNGVHYGGLLITGVALLTVLPVGHVLSANLAGGMLMMAYLHRVLRVGEPLGWQVLQGRPLLLEGLATGLLGAGAVALWFLVVDIMTSLPFYTPSALGSVLFLGAASPAQVRYSVGVIGAYTVLHVAAFVAVGVVFAWVARRIERAPAMWLMPVMAFIVVEGLFVGVVGTVSEWVLGALGWWAIGIGNVAAVGAMAWWVWQRHPRLREALGSEAVATRV